MAEPVWLGGADAVAQVSSITITGTWANNDTAVLTIGGYSLTLTVGTSVTTANIATAIEEMWNGTAFSGTGHSASNTGDEIQPFNEITAAADGSTVTFTHDTPGVPFTLTVSETTAGDGSLGSVTQTTAATGPEFWSEATNWSTGSVPTNSDDVVIDSRGNNWDIKWGLDQSSVALASLTIKNSFTKDIGLPETNVLNSSETYPEYRSTYLQIQTAILKIEGEGQGSSRVKIDLGSATATTMDVSARGSSSSATDITPPVLLKGTNASNILRVTRGTIGVAYYDGESAHLATLNVSYEENQAGDASVRLGDGVNIDNATITQTGGSLTLESATSTGTITQTGGSLTVNGGAHAQIDCSGTLYYNGSGTLTDLNLAGGTADFRRGSADVTVTNCEMGQGSTLYDPQKRVTFTNGINFYRCGINDVTIDLGKHLTLARSAI